MTNIFNALLIAYQNNRNKKLKASDKATKM